jgi:hypothetical protein
MHRRRKETGCKVVAQLVADRTVLSAKREGTDAIAGETNERLPTEEAISLPGQTIRSCKAVFQGEYRAHPSAKIFGPAQAKSATTGFT